MGNYFTNKGELVDNKFYNEPIMTYHTPYGRYNSRLNRKSLEEMSVPTYGKDNKPVLGSAIVQAFRPKPRYIGGDKQEVRDKFWKYDKETAKAVEQIASNYGISADLLKDRLDQEGFTDNRINSLNDYVLGKSDDYKYGYDYLYNISPYDAGYKYYGLDNVPSMINEGKINPKDSYWKNTGLHYNERGEPVYPATGISNIDNIQLIAAALQYFKNKAKKDFPNVSGTNLDRYASAYYNRGEGNGKYWGKHGAKGYDIRKRSLAGAYKNK